VLLIHGLSQWWLATLAFDGRCWPPNIQRHPSHRQSPPLGGADPYSWGTGCCRRLQAPHVCWC
jgi:hypothetical protein